MTKYRSIKFIETGAGLVSEEGPPVDAWQLGGEEARPGWLPAVSHAVSLPHIGNPDWHEPFTPGSVWSSAAYPDALYIGTPQGWHRCLPLDWVTHGDDGALNVVTHDEFASYYRQLT